MKAEKLLVNGIIYTGVSEKPFGYLAIAGNRIIGVGRGSGKDFAGRKTEVIDLKGKCVIPGFTDSHIHFMDYALNQQRVQLDNCSSSADVLNILRERAGSVSAGEWILGRGWKKTMFNGFPHRTLLDEIFPDNPVALNSHDEHFSWVNTRALKAAGLNHPIVVPGGYLGEDPDGTLNGIFGENAVALIRPYIAKPDATSRKNSLLAAQQKLHSMGVVAFHSTDANDAFGDLQDLHAEGKLKLRVFHSIPLRRLEEAVQLQLKTGLGDSFFRFGFVKIFSDGALGSQSALMLEPFDETGELGIETLPEEELTEKIKLALSSGIAVAVHAIGDRANRQVLNAFEKNKEFLKIPRGQSRIEHAQLLDPADIPRFRKIGIVASMQPFHAISDHDLAVRFWGKRARYSYAWRSLLNAKATLIFGSDAPVEHPDPIPALHAAVHRSNWEDRTESISPFQALLAYTWSPAVAAGEQQNRGSLETGKIADFAILSDDPLRGAFEGIKVLGTAVNGEFVYSDFQSS